MFCEEFVVTASGKMVEVDVQKFANLPIEDCVVNGFRDVFALVSAQEIIASPVVASPAPANRRSYSDALADALPTLLQVHRHGIEFPALVAEAQRSSPKPDEAGSSVVALLEYFMPGRRFLGSIAIPFDGRDPERTAEELDEMNVQSPEFLAEREVCSSFLEFCDGSLLLCREPVFGVRKKLF